MSDSTAVAEAVAEAVSEAVSEAVAEDQLEKYVFCVRLKLPFPTQGELFQTAGRDVEKMQVLV